MDYLGLSWTIRDYQGLSGSIMDYHGPSWAILDLVQKFTFSMHEKMVNKPKIKNFNYKVKEVW